MLLRSMGKYEFFLQFLDFGIFFLSYCGIKSN